MTLTEVGVAGGETALSGRTGRGFTAHLVREIEKISVADVSDLVIERARHALLDWLGVTIAGAGEPSARIVGHVIAAEGGTAVARLVGTEQRATARQAALAMGVAGHSMDYDDMAVGAHPSVVVLPGIIAVAEELDADGPSTLEAMIRGYEAMNMIANACGLVSYARGFHCTGTFGAFGAAVGVGRLLGLDAQHLQWALGSAGTQAAGLKASFGTMGKHLNAGNAAAVGVLSARLAQAGFTGATDVIEAGQGFAIAHNESATDFDATRAGTALGDTLAVEQIKFKPHAACGGTHSAIEGVREIKSRRPFLSDEVDEVVLTVSDQLPDICGIPEPRTGLEGMFSVRHAVSLVLDDRTTGPSSFTDERVNEQRLVELRQRVRVNPVARIPNVREAAEVTVRLKGGEVLQAAVRALMVVPDDQLAVQRARLEAKFRDLVGPRTGADRAEELISLVNRIDTLPSIRELVEKTAPSDAS